MPNAFDFFCLVVAILGICGGVVVAYFDRQRHSEDWAKEREWWRVETEKLMNRIQHPISEVARSQMDHDAEGTPVQLGMESEPTVRETMGMGRDERIAAVDEELARRGISAP